MNKMFGGELRYEYLPGDSENYRANGTETRSVAGRRAVHYDFLFTSPPGSLVPAFVRVGAVLVKFYKEQV